ncbi:MAG: CoA transferase [SAR202 cluster bacterium]|jgi:crotonobetainyl-CoA:carnitine CoA-transferase CaiB-like acyl-CoA transferase|nr:CoA transferase [Chloroflexota bacterium]MDP7231394.1 CoA transferase [Dehalococcoidia bacterium]MDP7612558.1 CoA transferase [Dehalococcoidia bacterium]MQG47292.1 CoA transferase [SAR202 cluster bacterium]|tara:strand:+ start:2164 stop:3366 length:1203 start_codon:yes stop_codon:yes gene_type:complete
MDVRNGPLSNVRVLAISQFGAGPFATLLLSDLGAEVIKIEDPESFGDVARSVPPYAYDGDSTYFQSFNRGKKSLGLNLRQNSGIKIFHDLVEKSSVVFNNLRGDLPKKLGLTYDTLKQINPSVVTCSLSGFGVNSDRSSEPGYDPIIQALAGYMSITGDKNSPPVKSGVSIIDFAGGFAASLAISAALVEVRSTGLGRDIDVGLFDTSLSMLSYFSSWHLNHGWLPDRTHLSAHQSITPAQNYKTSDGWVTIFCAKEKFWHDMAKTMNLSHLLNDPRFKTFDDRKNNRQLLNEIIEPLIVQKPTAYWVKLFLNKVPCAPVRSLPEALNDPLIKSRDMIIENNHPLRGVMRHVKSPFITDGANANVGPAPRLGQNTNEIMLELLGYKKSHVNELRQSGVII